jgi:small redox-active disulfide protein 2
MTIKILGPGCMNCRTLERRTQEAVEQLSLDAIIQKVEDYREISTYGIMSTPGLVIDDTLVSQGRVPTVDAIKDMIRQSRQ